MDRIERARALAEQRLGGGGGPDEAFLGRWELDEQGFRLYDSTGLLVIDLNSDTGSGTFKGEIRAGSKVLGSEAWFPSDDPAVARTRLRELTPVGAGIAGLQYYKAGETNDQGRGFVWVGQTNAMLGVDDTVASPNEREVQWDMRSNDPTYGAGAFLFTKNAEADYTATLWAYRASGFRHLDGIERMANLHRARNLFQIANYTLEYPGASTTTDALSVTFPAAFPTAPKATAGARGTSSTSQATNHCLESVSATAAVVRGRHVDASEPANGTQAGGSFCAGGPDA